MRNVFDREMTGRCLQMIGQSVVGTAKIIAFVLHASTEIPFAGNQKTVVVAKIVIERITITEFGFLEIAAECVGRFVIEKIA